MPPDLAFVLLFLRCAVAGVFLMLGTVSTVLWRQALAATPPAPASPAAPQRPATLLPYLAVLFYTIGLMLAIWTAR